MFYYLKPTSWTPKLKNLYAIKVNDELHPYTYENDCKDFDEGNKKTLKVFVRGTGWKSSKKVYKVPQYKGTTKEEWQDYLDKHGKYCLFYSITGFALGSNDCVVWAAQQEFKVTLSAGYDYMEKFLKKLNSLNSKIQKIVLDKYGVDIFEEKMQWIGDKETDGRIVSKGDLFVVKPSYSIMAYFLTKPHIDVVSDDSKLWKHYVNVVGYMNAKESEFPVQMRARIEFLFSKEVSDEYEKLMKEFPMS